MTQALKHGMGKIQFSVTRRIDKEWLQHEVMERVEGEAVGKVAGKND